MTPGQPHIAVAVADPDIRDLLREMLTEDGYCVQAIARPTRAAVLAGTRPDLIMLDLRLIAPTYGWRLLNALRAQPATQHLPIIAMTTDTRQVAERRAQLDAWEVRVCELPFDIDPLLSLVRESLAARRDSATIGAESIDTSGDACASAAGPACRAPHADRRDPA